MNLYNIEPQDLPAEFFIFVDPNSIIAQMNLSITGVFTSALYGSLSMNIPLAIKYMEGNVDYLPYEVKRNDMACLSPYYLTAINDIRIETDAEYTRLESFKHYPSRLSAIYAFGNYEDCTKASENYNWDLNTVKKFRLRSDDMFVKIAKVNMKVVSLARDFYRNVSLDKEQIVNIWNHYWNGKGNLKMIGPSNEVPGFRKIYDSEIIWEYLIEGSLVVIE